MWGTWGMMDATTRQVTQNVRLATRMVRMRADLAAGSSDRFAGSPRKTRTMCFELLTAGLPKPI